MAMRAGDIGVNLNVDVGENVADLTSAEIKIRSTRNGLVRTFTGTLIGTQIIRYATTLGTDVPNGSDWDIQAHVVQPGKDRHSTFGTLEVDDAL